MYWFACDVGIVTVDKMFRIVIVVNVSSATINVQLNREVAEGPRTQMFSRGEAPHKPSGPSVSLYWLLAKT